MYFCINIVEKIGYRDKIIILDFLTPQTIAADEEISGPHIACTWHFVPQKSYSSLT
jgi:hypothetical protein